MLMFKDKVDFLSVDDFDFFSSWYPIGARPTAATLHLDAGGTEAISCAHEGCEFTLWTFQFEERNVPCTLAVWFFLR